MSPLRSWFGPSKKEIWQQFSAETGGQYVAGDFLRRDKVEATHGQWTVTLDLHSIPEGRHGTTYTRFRAPYVNPDGFHFFIYRKTLFSGIGKRFGMQDIVVGFPEFDDAFIIQGNNPEKVVQLFANPKIRQLITAQPHIYFSVFDRDNPFPGGELPPGVSELSLQVVGTLTDIALLKQLYDLLSEVLDELCRLGSAYEKPPGVQL